MLTETRTSQFSDGYDVIRSYGMAQHGDAKVVRLPVAVGDPAVPDDNQGHRGELALLGGFQLQIGAEPVQVRVSGQRLIAALVCRPSTTTRSQLAHLLWPDVTSERAHANLRTVVYRLQRRCPGLVTATSYQLRLAPDITVDLERTTRLVTQVVSVVGPVPPALLGEALRVNLYDDLLPDWDDEWLTEYQSRYRQLRLTTLEQLSHHLAANGQYGAAVHTAMAAVHADSLRDSAHQTLIRACLAQGNRYEAQAHFAAYQRIFRDELGVEPATTLEQLMGQSRVTVRGRFGDASRRMLYR